MKKGLFILQCMAVLGCLWAVSACEKQNEETPVAFEFTVTAPQGWTVTSSVGTKTISVTAPGAKDKTAAAGASVTYIPKDQWSNNTILSWIQ